MNLCIGTFAIVFFCVEDLLLKFPGCNIKFLIKGAVILHMEYSSEDVLLSNVKCNGSEDSLTQCDYVVIANDGIDPCEDHAGVICQGTIHVHTLLIIKHRATPSR